MISKLTVFGFLFLFLALRISREPVPKDSSEPFKMKVLLSSYRFIFYLGQLGELFGISSAHYTRRLLLDTLSNVVIRSLPGVKTEDTDIEGVKVRIYVPEGKEDRAPGIVYYHGGGWTIGSIDVYHAVTSFMAKDVNAVVVSVEYRLCPEHSLLDGLQDVLTVTKHFMKNAEAYGVDPERIAISGDSAGGHLTANVAIKLRDERFPIQPKLQVLIYPAVQFLDLDLPSHQEHAVGNAILNRHSMMWMMSNALTRDSSMVPHLMDNAYVPPDVRSQFAKGRINHDIIPKELKHKQYSPSRYQRVDSDVWDKVRDNVLSPEYSPLLAKSHQDLPEAYIFTAMNDPVRDESFLYEHRLKQAGVKVTQYTDKKGWHGMINFVGQLIDSTNSMIEITNFMKSKL